MAIRLFSDLHMEFADFTFPELETDKNDVLVLAGDIAVAEHPQTFDRVREWVASNRFKKVIHIPGNHEYYKGSFLRVRSKIKDTFPTGADTIALNNEVVRVDDVSFICATMWTDFNNGNPVIMEIVRSGLNDYNYIRTGNKGAPYLRKINAHDIHHANHESKKFIFDNIVSEKLLGQKVVVVTHHGPTLKSVHPKYKGDPINWGYVSDLEQQILDDGPDLWVHGHTHYSFDYTVGNTRVVTNPRGYARLIRPGYAEAPYFVNENEDFNPTLRIEV